MKKLHLLRCLAVFVKSSVIDINIHRTTPFYRSKSNNLSCIVLPHFKMSTEIKIADLPKTNESQDKSHFLTHQGAPSEGNDPKPDLSENGNTGYCKDGQETSNQMSRRETKRLKRQMKNEELKARKRQKKMEVLNSGGSTSNKEPSLEEDSLNETSFFFENGLRKVYPYYFKFKSYAKGRWFNRKLIDVMVAEMGMYDRDHYVNAINSGLMTINGKPTTTDYILKNGDLVEHLVHRHETPVIDAKIEIVEETNELLVINKPSSIPVHPCGSFRHNSITYILAREYNKKGLRGTYRLDRATSGVLMYAKTHKKAEEVMSLISSRKVEKEYLCRVEGEFPKETVTCGEPLQSFSGKLAIHRVSPNGKEAKTTFDRLSYNGTSSVVKCKPFTGRTHQIRVHLQYIGYPIVNDPMYNTIAWGPKKGKGGEYGKTDEKLLEDLAKVHDPKNYIIRTTDVDHRTMSHPEGSTFELDKLTVDENCEQCKTLYMDPEPKHNTLYLHALRYKGPDFDFQTDIPEWAKEDWKE